MSTTAIPTVTDILARLDKVQADKRASSKQALDQNGGAPHGKPTEKDPNDQGTKEIPKVTEGEAGTPTGGRKAEDFSSAPGTPPVQNVPGGKVGVGLGPNGTEVPSTVDGKAKDDAATSPTTDLSKIAALVGRITALRTAAGAPAPVKEAAAAPATGTEPVIEKFDQNMLSKLAALFLSSEEGVKQANEHLTRAYGAEAARNLLVEARNMHTQLVKEAAAQQEYLQSADYQRLEMVKRAKALYDAAPAEEKARIDRIDKVHTSLLNTISDPMEKMAYEQGVIDAANYLDSIVRLNKAAGMPPGAGGPPPGGDPMGGGGMPPGGDPSGGAGGPPPGPGGEGEIPGGGGGPASLEEIVQVLQAAVQSGQIDEQTAQGVLAELAKAMGGGQGGDPMGGGGMPPGGDPSGGAGGPPPGAGGPPPGAGGPGPDAGAGGAPDMPEEAKSAAAIVAKYAPTVRK